MEQTRENEPEVEEAQQPEDAGLDEQQRKHKAVAEAFSPAAPVNRRDLFAGRIAQLAKVMNVVAGRGEHAVIYGERGVGKTSLASIAALLVEASGDAIAVRINCDGGDTYASIWRKALSKIKTLYSLPGVGFAAENREIVTSAADSLPADPAPHDVETALEIIARSIPVVVFIDEFDRVTDTNASRLMADTIKTLSDQGVDATVVLVGVADDLTDLIAEHESIERGVRQIPMPRMSDDELREIVRRGLESAEMSIEEEAQARITQLSQGLPHYTHLLAQEAARSAVIAEKDHIAMPDVIAAMERAVKRSPQTLSERYHAATSSPRATTLYPAILLAAALAKGDELGYFAASDIRDPLRAITRKPYEIPAFSPHLHKLSEPGRGEVLQKTGEPRRHRFRFRNPLLQPYVILRALAEEELRVEVLDQFLSR